MKLPSPTEIILKQGKEKMKIKRQGLSTSIEELRGLADELEEQLKEEEKKLGVSLSGQIFQVGIINKTPTCSDTWELE